MEDEVIIEWQENTIYRRSDDSFVITYNGFPFHVPNEGEYAELYAEVLAYAEEHPEQVEEEQIAPYVPTTDELFAMLRAERNARLRSTDHVMLSDYPITAEDRGLMAAYRQALRDLPAASGAPWDGGGEQTPWPEIPVAIEE